MARIDHDLIVTFGQDNASGSYIAYRYLVKSLSLGCSDIIYKSRDFRGTYPVDFIDWEQKAIWVNKRLAEDGASIILKDGKAHLKVATPMQLAGDGECNEEPLTFVLPHWICASSETPVSDEQLVKIGMNKNNLPKYRRLITTTFGPQHVESLEPHNNLLLSADGIKWYLRYVS